MNELEMWDRAARLERCAIGWELDSERYLGARRTWRIERATTLREGINALLEGIDNANF